MSHSTRLAYHEHSQIALPGLDLRCRSKLNFPSLKAGRDGTDLRSTILYSSILPMKAIKSKYEGRFELVVDEMGKELPGGVNKVSEL